MDRNLVSNPVDCSAFKLLHALPVYCETTHDINMVLPRSKRPISKRRLQKKLAHARECKAEKRTILPTDAADNLPATRKRTLPLTRRCLEGAFAVLFFLVHNNLALSLAPAFVMLAKTLGLVLTHLSRPTITKMLSFSANRLLLDVVTLINDPSNEYLALLFDESTDVTRAKTLIVFVRMLLCGKPVELFLDNIVLQNGCTAPEITSTLLTRLTEIGVDIEALKTKLLSIGTDGASVMTGKLSGVGQRLRAAGFKRLIQIHCFAHRCDLISKDVFNKHASKKIQDAIKACRDIAAAIRTSAVSVKAFEKLCPSNSRR